MKRLAFIMPSVRVLPQSYRRSATLVRHAEILDRAGIVADIGQADHEDSVEFAARTNAAVDLLPRHGAVAATLLDGGAAVSLADGKRLHAAEHDFREWCSPTGEGAARRDTAYPPLFDRNPPYWASPAFARNAGRPVMLCRNSGEDAPEGLMHLPAFEEAFPGFAERHAPGSRRMAVKLVGGGLKEYGVSICTAREMRRELGYSLVHRWNGCTLMQGVVDMTHEYRFLVIGGRIAAGTGTSPELTADDMDADQTMTIAGAACDIRTFGQFDLPVSVRAAVVEGHAEFAMRALREFAEEGMMPGDFTLDVFLDGETGGRGIVELNPVGAAGYFAADPNAVMRRAVERATAPSHGEGKPR